MVDTQLPKRAKDVYIQWKLENSEYKSGEIVALLFLGITAFITIFAFIGKLPFMFYVFIFPVSKLHVDWKKEMPVMAELVESFKGISWDSSSKFALFITSLIALTEIGIVILFSFLI